jgi:hypothetical protein
MIPVNIMILEKDFPQKKVPFSTTISGIMEFLIWAIKFERRNFTKLSPAMVPMIKARAHLEIQLIFGKSLQRSSIPRMSGIM